jgi:hypothetical protein
MLLRIFTALTDIFIDIYTDLSPSDASNMATLKQTAKAIPNAREFKCGDIDIGSRNISNGSLMAMYGCASATAGSPIVVAG